MKLKNISLLALASLTLLITGCNNNTPPSTSSSNDSPSSIPPKLDTKIKIMSCNLDQANGNNQEKQLAISNQIKKVMPDLFGVQEETHDWENFLKPEFEKYGYEHIVTYRGGPFDEASGIFYSVDRFTLVDKGTFWLGSDENAGPGYIATDWGAQYPRVCTFAILKDKKTEQNISFFNTHFDYTHDVPVRKNSAEQVINKMKEKNLPGFFTGDLNFFRENEEDTYNTLTAYFDDAWAQVENSPQSCTFHDYGKELNPETRVNPFSPIDYILSTKNDFTHLDFNILTQEGPDFYSDHFFVSATFDYISK